jgi:hypothetical protein
MLPQGAYPGGGHLTRNDHRQGELTENGCDLTGLVPTFTLEGQNRSPSRIEGGRHEGVPSVFPGSDPVPPRAPGCTSGGGCRPFALDPATTTLCVRSPV